MSIDARLREGLAMIEQQLPDVDTPEAYDDVITTGRTRTRRRTALLAAAAVVAAALALVGLKALGVGNKPEVVVPPPSPVDWILAETGIGLRLIDPDGASEPAPDPKGTFASWSPDGGQIAYVLPSEDDSYRDLWMASVTTGTKKRLVHCAGCKVLGADWSPDGTDLAYTVLRPDGSTDLRVIVGSTDASMRDLGTGDWGWPQWSPDGTVIALGEARGTQGFVVLLGVEQSTPAVHRPRRSSSAVPSAGAPERIVGPIEGVKRVSWSPDGTRLAFTAGATDLTPEFTANLFVVNADGTGLRQVTHVLDGTRVFAVEWETDPEFPFMVSLAGPTEDYSQATLAQVSADGARVQPIYRQGVPISAFRAAYRF
jgi:dipeptidyl aminopeptidase/acylaminoacyl peptidase